MTIATDSYKNILPTSRPALVGITATAAMLGYIGPFGTTARLGLKLSFFFWGVLILLSIASAEGLKALVANRTKGWSALWREAFTLVVFTILYTPQVVFLVLVFNWTNELRWGLVLETGAAVFLVSLWLISIRSVLRYWYKEASGAASSSAPRLVQRLAASDSPPIVRLSAEDHYVVVGFADSSTERLLMRLSDGIAEMDGIEGYPTHRSHWVAASAVSGSRKENGRVFLTLSNGDEVPVSRGYQAALKEAGVLA